MFNTQERKAKTMCVTHETFIHNVAALATARVTDSEARDKLASIKLVYGAGQSGLRGVTYYKTWKNGHADPMPFVEVCAFGQEHWVQVAGTTIHELAHVIAEGDGHGKGWRAACELLGLRRARAAGHRYMLASFAPDIRNALALMAKPDEGAPVTQFANMGLNIKLRPCGAGLGVRGGKTRGQGSGSRLRRYSCDCERPVIVRVASDDFAAHCDHCNSAFHK